MSRFPHNSLSRYLVHRRPRASQTLCIGLSERGAAWLFSASLEEPRWNYAEWDTSAPPFDASAASAALQTVLQIVRPAPRERVIWMLAPGLARSWLHAPSAQVTSLAEQQAIVQVRANQLIGRGSFSDSRNPQWRVAARWDASRAFLCTVTPEPWGNALHSLTRQRKRDCVLTPLALVLDCFKDRMPADGWIAMSIAGELCISYWQKKRMVRLHCVRLPVDTTPATALEHAVKEWHREKLRLQREDVQLRWLDVMHPFKDTASSPTTQSIKWPYQEMVPAIHCLLSDSVSEENEKAKIDALRAAWTAVQLTAKLS